MEVSQDDLLAAWVRRAFKTTPSNPTFMKAWKEDLQRHLELNGFVVVHEGFPKQPGATRIYFDFWAEKPEFVIEMTQDMAEKVVVLGFP